MDEDEWITLTETARRLELDLGGVSKLVRRWGIPRRVPPHPDNRNAVLVRWSDVLAHRKHPVPRPAPASSVSLTELAERSGFTLHTLLTRCRVRGIERFRGPGERRPTFVQADDVPRVLASRGDENRPDPATGTKRCSTCGEVRPLADFHPKPTSTGLASQCRDCANARTLRNIRLRAARARTASAEIEPAEST